MKIILKWQVDKEGKPILACAINSAHDKMIISVGKQIFLMEASTGKELRTCEKHQDDVTCLAFRKDGLMFSSGSKDKIVYLWDMNNLAKPVNKITFVDPVISVVYNPCIFSLLCLSKSYASLYKESTDKTTTKLKLTGNATCCGWSSDGLRFAIGFENGTIVFRDKDNEKDIKQITLNTKNPERIWCLAFSSLKHRNKEYVLYVGTWEKNIYLFELLNYDIIDVKKVVYDPICIGLFKDDYFLIGTNNSEVNFFTKEGSFITKINENINDWSLAVKQNNKNDSFVVCTNDGKVINYGVTFNVVHAIYNEKYVYRQNMMDVYIHDLLTNTKNKIKTKSYIMKLAIYKDNLAVLTTDKIGIYKLNPGSDEVSKISKHFIKWDTPCNLILLTSFNVLVCLENRLVMFAIGGSGSIEREWSFEAGIKYIKVVGGAPGRESIIAGLKNGEIYMIFIDNQFPILLYQHEISIRCLDLSINRKKLAIVDDNYDILVIDVGTKTIFWKEGKAKSVAFNSEIDEMLCYSYEGSIFIRTSTFAPVSEKMSGAIVGFKGTKIFSLQASNSINVMDVSHSSSIMKYVERKNFAEAYKVACLGATAEEWAYLGFEALLNFDLVVAVNCFKKYGDIRYINLVFKIEQDVKDKISKDVIIGEILSFKGRFKEASESFIKGGAPEKALDMFSTLKKFPEAIEIKNKHLGNSDITISEGLLSDQADWLMETGKFKDAADLYMAIGKTKRAIEIYGEKKYLDNLIDICRSLNKSEHSELIMLCGSYFKKYNHHAYAKEAFLKLGDLKGLILMHIELKSWNEAFSLAGQNNNLLQFVHLQYAGHLITEDRFEEAQSSYKKAGRVDLSMKMLENLIDNAICEKRFKDASNYYYKISTDTLTLINSFTNPQKQDNKNMKEYDDYMSLSHIYNAYDTIFKYIEEPFSKDLINIDTNGLFNACKFLVNKFSSLNTSKQVKGISLSYVYYALAFLAKEFDAFKTARTSFEKLNTLIIPPEWQEKIDFETIAIRSKPFTDKDNNNQHCFRCYSSNPLINPKGDICATCSNRFVRSPISNEVLPVVEFKPKGIDDNKAIELIKQNKNIYKQKENAAKTNLLVISNGPDKDENLFDMKLMEWCESHIGSEDYGVFEIDENLIKKLNESEIYIVDQRNFCPSKPVKFYKNRTKDMFITMCKYCFEFFRTEEYENYYLQNNYCPYCREKESF